MSEPREGWYWVTYRKYPSRGFCAERGADCWRIFDVIRSGDLPSHLTLGPRIDDLLRYAAMMADPDIAAQCLRAAEGIIDDLSVHRESDWSASEMAEMYIFPIVEKVVAAERARWAKQLEDRAARLPTESIFNGKIMREELRAQAARIRSGADG